MIYIIKELIYGHEKFSPELEKNFQNYYLQSILPLIRFAFLLGTILYSAFGILDIYLMPETKYYVWIIRFGFVVPILILTLILSYKPFYLKHYKFINFFSGFVAGLGILLMILLSKENELGYFYYIDGLNLIILWMYSILRLSIRLSNLLAFLFIFLYTIIAVGIKNLNFSHPAFLTGNLFFMVSSAFLGSIVNFVWEGYSRNKYSQFQKIRYLNSHSLRAPTARMLGLIDSFSNTIESNKEIKTINWFYLLAESGKDIDKSINELNSYLTEINHLVNNNSDEISTEDLLFDEVYFVDDDSIVNMLSKGIVKKVCPDIPIKIFTSPNVALGNLENSRDKIILLFLDINMPEMSGFDFLEVCLEKKLKPYVVMLTSSIDEEDKLRSFSFNCVIAYISKPLKPKHIHKFLNSWV